MGSRIRTTARNKSHELASLGHAIKCAIDAVARLPFAMHQKAHLISAKALSKLWFAAELNPATQATMDSLKACVVRALWRSRPHSRQADILVGLVLDPLRLHPAMSHAVHVIVNVAERCRCDARFCRQLVDLLAHKALPFGLLDVFLKALASVGVRFVPPLAPPVAGLSAHPSCGLHSACLAAFLESCLCLESLRFCKLVYQTQRLCGGP